jgi:poly(3-hydroxybutyrate) depolymerase
MRLMCVSILVVMSLASPSGQQAPGADAYDAAAARVKKGREYRQARTGRIQLPTTVGGVTLDNVLDVPADYDPARRWPLRVSLHGGVGRPHPGPNDPPPRPLTNRTVSVGELVLHPRAWSGVEWWTSAQIENIQRLVDRVKRDYNVDESRVYVTGISDGGTAVYFLAMRAASLWAACLPLNGHPLVLANPDSGTDGMLFSTNLSNCPLRVVNGGRDPLYPAASVAPLIAMFRRGGIVVDFQVYPDAGHDVSWWPRERPAYEAFLAAHPRVPHPERITWETERTDRYNRFRWLVIDRLGARGSDRPLADVNRFAAGNGSEQLLFARGRASGRVDITRRGNTFEAHTRGVTAFTLLLSPDVVDFSRPVRVSVNGRPAYDGTVIKSRETLETWAARDNDRTMLYGAELKISVP